MRSARAVAIGFAISLAACHRTALPPKPDGAAVVTTETPVPGDVPLAPEVEPNDTLATAQKVALDATLAGGVAGSLHEGQGKARDTDLFRLDVPAPAGAPTPPPAPRDATADAAGAPSVLRRALRVDVKPADGVAVSFEALDDQGQALAATGAGQPGEALALPNVAVTPGVYYLRLRAAPAVPGAGGAGGSATASYRLTVHIGPLEAGAEVEPNGKAAIATDLAVPGEAVGFYGWRHDQDWFRVPTAGLAEGSVLGADLDPAPGVTASLLVFDSVEQKLTEVRGRKEERVALRSVRVPTGEPYVYVVVRADAGWNADARYALRLTSGLPEAGAEIEPNDDTAHAQAVADVAEGGAITVAGHLGRGDVDVFRYAATIPVELDVEVAPPERVDVKLEVLRPDGTVLAKSDTGKRRESEHLPNVFVPGGAAFIRLSAAKGDGNADEPYRLSIAVHPPEPGAEREPNDALATATELPPGAVGGGLIAPRGDVDFWRAAAPPDAQGNVNVSVGGVPGVPLDVHVRATGGEELGRFAVAAGAPAGANVIATGGQPCCVVEVRAANAKAAANPRDRYSLAVGK
ncbi:MAG TPA: hypothetical protein VHJ20_17670 [Polyangia bacterium]|nr:hypothetical protein [Polyangia bacterium]